MQGVRADAANESATLTVEGKAVIFRQGAVSEKYELVEVPNLKLLEIIPRTLVKDGEEIDVSEMIFQTGEGREIRLTQGRPVAVVRSKAGDGSWIWGGRR